MTYGSRVSRAPPNHILPAFQNQHGTFISSEGFLCYSNFTNDNGTDYEDLCVNTTNCDNRNGKYNIIVVIQFWFINLKSTDYEDLCFNATNCDNSTDYDDYDELCGINSTNCDNSTDYEGEGRQYSWMTGSFSTSVFPHSQFSTFFKMTFVEIWQIAEMIPTAHHVKIVLAK